MNTIKIVLRGGPEDDRTLAVEATANRFYVPKIVDVTLSSFPPKDMCYPAAVHTYTRTRDVRMYPDQTFRWVFDYIGEA